MPGGTPSAGWLYTIAARRLIDHQRRGLTEQRALAALAQNAERDPVATLESPADHVRGLASGVLRHLPREQRQAIISHLIRDLDYAQMASHSQTSEASIRQRVSRGLSVLREPLRVHRAAHALAAQDRTYDLGGGHARDLRSIRAGEPLDCSSSTSLILQRAGLFEPGPAWTTDRLASSWGRRGEGRYVTVWVDDAHVWIEFKLDADDGEIFDPTPARHHPDRDWARVRDPKRGCTPRHWPGL